MRIGYGILAGCLWILFISYMMSKGSEVSGTMQILTLSIIAGAMAGGDDHES